MKFFSILLSLPAFCFAMEAENYHLPHDIKSKFISFCQIIQQRDVIYKFSKPEDIPGKVFSPKDSFEISKHLKSGGAYIYDGPDLKFQIPYSIGKATKDSPLFCYEKSKGNLTLNFFLQGLGKYKSIIQGYKAWNQYEIKKFAGNVIAILERDEEGIVLFQKEHDIVKPALEIGALVLTSERLRSEKSLLLAYIEFLKLEYDPSQQRLKKMFLEEQPTLSLLRKSRGLWFL